MDVRKLKILFTKGGSGSVTTKITIPKAWIDRIGITEANKEVVACLDESEGQIILRKMKEGEVILTREEKKAEYMRVIREEVDPEKGIELHEEDRKNGFEYIVRGLEESGVNVTEEKKNEILMVLDGKKDPDYQIAKLFYRYLLEQDEQGEREFAIYNISLKKEIFNEMAAQVQADFFNYFKEKGIEPYGKDKELEICKIHVRLCDLKYEILFKRDTLPELEEAAEEIKRIRAFIRREEGNGV